MFGLRRNKEQKYIVLRAVSDLVYKVKRSKAEKPKYVHHDQMKPFRCETDEHALVLLACIFKNIFQLPRK